MPTFPLNKVVTKQEIFFITILPFVALCISRDFYVRAESVLVFIASFIYILKYDRNIRVHNNIFLIAVLFFLVWGTFIGLVYVGLGYNDLFKHIQYSYLAFSFYVGLRYGYLHAKGRVVDFVYFLGFSQSILMIPLILNLEFYRSHIGVSNLFPALLLFTLFPNIGEGKRSTSKVFGVIILSLQVCCILLSGMRAAIGTSALSVLVIALYFMLDKNNKTRGVFLKKVFILLALCVAVVFVLPESIKTTMGEKVESVVTRFSKSLFNKDGVQIDPIADEGRPVEARSLMNAIEKRNNGNILLFGYGHGFVYFDEMKYEIKAHSHITILAFYSRYGVVGVILYGFMFLFTAYKIGSLFLKPRYNNNAIRLALWLGVLQILLSSLFAANLIYIMNWIFIGLAVSYDRLASKSLIT